MYTFKIVASGRFLHVYASPSPMNIAQGKIFQFPLCRNFNVSKISAFWTPMYFVSTLMRYCSNYLKIWEYILQWSWVVVTKENLKYLELQTKSITIWHIADKITISQMLHFASIATNFKFSFVTTFQLLWSVYSLIFRLFEHYRMCVDTKYMGVQNTLIFETLEFLCRHATLKLALLTTSIVTTVPKLCVLSNR